jgi:hypothetical protein
MTYKEKPVIAVAIVAILYLARVDAHTMGLGSCPRIEPLKDFDMEKVRTFSIDFEYISV